MTTIIDPEVPSIGAADAMLDSETSTSRFIVFAGVVAVVMTLLNLAATVYFFRSMGELRAAEQQLERLADFEARIIAKIDQLNTGVQSRFEDLDGDLQGHFNDLIDRVGKLERTPGNATAMAPSPEPVPTEMAPQVAPLEETPPELEAATDPVAAPRPPRRASMPSPSAAYQRLETAEGKVYYRKVK
ncbi:hypothetical protein PV773_00490 [Mesorhizobium sp. CC13]|uniref:hypothetical protein n=1 Tax=Mesorhizobium sp. CC13 TaxID=3029194 RepID=UPI00326526D5